MGKTKAKKQNKFVYYIKTPIRILTMTRDFYTKSMFECAGRIDQGSIMNSTAPQVFQLPKNFNLRSSKRSNDEYYWGRARLASARHVGGAKINAVDFEGNIVSKKPAIEAAVEVSYSVGIGKIGRIDEDRTCEFKEINVDKFLHPSTTISIFQGNVVC